jgi:hypothetical protein
MATEPENQNQSVGRKHRHVLKALAMAPHGCDVNVLLTKGVKLEAMAELVRGGLATVELQSMAERDSNVQIACIRITSAGLCVLEGVVGSG